MATTTMSSTGCDKPPLREPQQPGASRRNQNKWRDKGSA
jgi:hypothetical protein